MRCFYPTPEDSITQEKIQDTESPYTLSVIKTQGPQKLAVNKKISTQTMLLVYYYLSMYAEEIAVEDESLHSILT